MASISDSLNAALDLEGAIGAALVDYQSGMALGVAGGGTQLNLEVAAAGNTEVVRAKMRVMEQLGLGADGIEDILITLGSQYHLIRPLKKHKDLFMYVAIDRQKGNLALARHKIAAIESTLQV